MKIIARLLSIAAVALALLSIAAPRHASAKVAPRMYCSEIKGWGQVYYYLDHGVVMVIMYTQAPACLVEPAP